MKKIAYSSYTKFIATILIVVCAVLCVNTLIDGIMEYESLNMPHIYGFESDFTESGYFSSLLYIPDNIFYNEYQSYVNEQYQNARIPDDISTGNIVVWTPIFPIADNMQKALEHLNNSDEIDYFMQINGRIYTNCDATSKAELLNRRFFTLSEIDAYGNTNYDSSIRWRNVFYLDELDIPTGDTVTICTAIKEDYADYCEKVWKVQASMVRDIFTSTLIYVIGVLILLAYLIAVSGKKADGSYRLMWIDNLWSEVHLAVMTIPTFFIILVIAMILDTLFAGQIPLYMAKSISLTLTAIGMLIILTSLLSLIRKIKCNKILESSIIFIIAKHCFKLTVNIFKWIRQTFIRYRTLLFKTLSKKSGIMLVCTLLIYTAIIGLCGIFTPETPFAFILAVIIFGVASFILSYRARDLDEIKKGVSEVKSGNLTHKISDIKSEDLKILSYDINDIAEGLDKSVADKLKAEKLKTELITNVSHDLKTPLTSIISYTELLSSIDGLPEEANDYLKIIAKKSDRLKNLTQDLFDISKVQSGNEQINFEKIDISLLINQSLGEQDKEIKDSGLTFCVNTPKELNVLSDGRKMSRVIHNLINNILKYSLNGTRVFITAFEQNEEVIVEFKNIASYPMDFNVDEIVGRFVRGDKSRTEEGSGLGLAISKSYTEASGGVFNVAVDGDMFKAIIRFKKYN